VSTAAFADSEAARTDEVFSATPQPPQEFADTLFASVGIQHCFHCVQAANVHIVKWPGSYLVA
jgi:hypothetical protein